MRRRILDTHDFGLGYDKLTFHAVMSGFGFPVPRLDAVFAPCRSVPDAAKLHSIEALAAYLRVPEHYPFFSKPTYLTASLGSASVAEYDPKQDEVVLANGSRFGVKRFVEEAQRYFSFTGGYIIQERLRPHPAVAQVAGPAASTVRIMVLTDDGAPEIICATWRVPAGRNHADALWRGNLMAALDPETGEVKRVIKGSGPALTEQDEHPDTGRRLIGYRLPLWQEARDLALAAAAAVPALQLTGWDVAITDRGPVLIELEPDGGEPMVTPLASGEGLLAGPYGDFVRRHLKRKRKR